VPKERVPKPVAKRTKEPVAKRTKEPVAKKHPALQVPAAFLVLCGVKLAETLRERDEAYALNLELSQKLEALSRRSLVQRVLNSGV
jgi:hypothetical protein